MTEEEHGVIDALDGEATQEGQVMDPSDLESQDEPSDLQEDRIIAMEYPVSQETFARLKQKAKTGDPTNQDIAQADGSV